MSYSEITFNDRNRIKRWFQQQRLKSALELGGGSAPSPAVICDFGAGNGELCRHLAEYYPDARIICYEPTPGLLSEARENLKGIGNVDFLQDIGSLAPASTELVFCLEVFEHLPPRETREALAAISAMLHPKGKAVIGVPVEVGVPALYKGIFRMSRRYGSFDANIKNVLLSFMGRPPQNRPMGEIAPGFGYYFQHTGFDFREFRKTLCKHFVEIRVAASPFSILGTWLMPEVYFCAEKTKR